MVHASCWPFSPGRGKGAGTKYETSQAPARDSGLTTCLPGHLTPHQLQHLPRRGMPTAGPLGKDQGAIHRHLEHAARGLHQAHLRLGEELSKLGRQTGGPWLIVSNNAVFDGDLHDGASGWGEPPAGRSQGNHLWPAAIGWGLDPLRDHPLIGRINLSGHSPVPQECRCDAPSHSPWS